MTLKTYIENKRNNRFTHAGIEIVVKNFPENVNLSKVLSMVTSSVPRKLLSNVERILIGQFEELQRRKIQAMYKDKTVYVTSTQDNDQDMLDDIIHEVAHSVEEIYQQYLYSDSEIKDEFLEKRKNMWMTLRDNEVPADIKDFLNTDFDENFDKYLYSKIGYPIISALCSRIFYSPYASTSLREYFANGFEAFFMREDIDRLQKISPKLYKKIVGLLEV